MEDPRCYRSKSGDAERTGREGRPISVRGRGWPQDRPPSRPGRHHQADGDAHLVVGDSQDRAPLFDAIRQHLEAHYTPFHVPAHTGGRGMDPQFRKSVGRGLALMDLTELPGLDNLLAPEGPIKEACELAALLYGADRTFFLVNGASAGIAAMILACLPHGGDILLPRDVHVSAINALVLSGGKPIYIKPRIHGDFALPLGPSPEDISRAISLHPDVGALLVVRPNYYGVAIDIERVVALGKKYGKIVMVDEAHGAHWRLHEGFPEDALSAGADIVVQSTHKTGGSLTQTAMLHVKSARINIHRLAGSLRLLQTTSPSYVLMASLDAARRQMAIRGRELLDGLLQLAALVRHGIARIPGLRCLEASNLDASAGFVGIDPTRLVINVTGLGITGIEAGRWLRKNCRVEVEFCDFSNVIAILSLGNTERDARKLVRGFRQLARACGTPAGVPSLDAGGTSPAHLGPRWADTLERLLSPPKQGLSPREAFWARSAPVPLCDAVGRVSAEAVVMYPPGVPAVCPGDEIDKERVEALELARGAGADFLATSRDLEFIRVVAD